jgi:hypothetical protein
MSPRRARIIRKAALLVNSDARPRETDGIIWSHRKMVYRAMKRAWTRRSR